MLPGGGPGLARRRRCGGGLDTPGIAAALAAGELTAVYLLAVDPLRDLPDRGAWEQALERASTVIAHAAFLTDGVREHATVVFPAEAAAEKEGTVTHPDGRVQRMRPAIARQGAVRAEWSVLAELAARLGAAGVAAHRRRRERGAVRRRARSTRGLDARASSPGTACAGRSARRRRRAAGRPPARSRPPAPPRGRRPAAAAATAAARSAATARSGPSPEVEASPALRFLVRAPARRALGRRRRGARRARRRPHAGRRRGRRRRSRRRSRCATRSRRAPRSSSAASRAAAPTS